MHLRLVFKCVGFRTISPGVVSPRIKWKSGYPALLLASEDTIQLRILVRRYAIYIADKRGVGCTLEVNSQEGRAKLENAL